MNLFIQDLPPGDHGGVPVLVDAGPREDGGRQADWPDLSRLRDGRKPRLCHLRPLPCGGRPSRGPLRPVSLLHRRGDSPVAQPQVPRDGHPQTGGRHRRVLPVRPLALDR